MERVLWQDGHSTRDRNRGFGIALASDTVAIVSQVTGAVCSKQHTRPYSLGYFAVKK